MYPKHKNVILGIIILSIVIATILNILDINFDKNSINNFTSVSITFTAITMGFYIASMSSLLSSKYIKLLNKKDDTIPSQRKVHTVIYYFKYSIYCSLLTIFLSFVLMIFNNSFQQYIFQYIFVTIFTVEIGTIIANIFFVHLIFQILSNALTEQAKEEDIGGG